MARVKLQEGKGVVEKIEQNSDKSVSIYFNNNDDH